MRGSFTLARIKLLHIDIQTKFIMMGPCMVTLRANVTVIGGCVCKLSLLGVWKTLSPASSQRCFFVAIGTALIDFFRLITAQRHVFVVFTFKFLCLKRRLKSIVKHEMESMQTNRTFACKISVKISQHSFMFNVMNESRTLTTSEFWMSSSAVSSSSFSPGPHSTESSAGTKMGSY